MIGWTIPGRYVESDSRERERVTWYHGYRFVAVKWVGTPARATLIKHPSQQLHAEVLVWNNRAARNPDWLI